ncbi:hypothetical protein AALP_AAs72347U000100, partial [Arabis alpina]
MNKLTDMADIPFTHIPQDVYETAAQWIERHVEYHTVCAFVLWSFGFTHARFLGKPTPPKKSQLAVFVVLSIILRSNGSVLFSVLRLLSKPPYQTEDAHDMVPLSVWLMAQMGDDIGAGLYVWSRNLLPLVIDKNKCKPESTDLVLQFIEKIVWYPNSRDIIL